MATQTNRIELTRTERRSMEDLYTCAAIGSCPECLGAGQYAAGTRCDACEGRGYTEAPEHDRVDRVYFAVVRNGRWLVVTAGGNIIADMTGRRIEEFHDKDAPETYALFVITEPEREFDVIGAFAPALAAA